VNHGRKTAASLTPPIAAAFSSTLFPRASPNSQRCTRASRPQPAASQPRSHHATLTPLLIACAVGTCLSGCGGGQSSSPTTTGVSQVDPGSYSIHVFSNGRISNGYTNAFSYRPVGPAFMVRIANAFTYSKSHSSPAADRKQRRGEARRLGTTPPGLRPQNLRIAGFGRIDSHRG
jgi:hypothetical protein